MNKFFVQGDSMNPLLHDGDVVSVEPADRFEVGDIVVAEHPFKKSVTLIKRIGAVRMTDGGPRYTLEGTNPKASTDSRTLGEFTDEMILGVARPI